MADVPLRIIGDFDASKIAKGITGIQNQVKGLGGTFKNVLGGLITAAAIQQIFRFGESIDVLSDNLETLNSIAGGTGDALVKAMSKAADGDLTYRQSVGITIGAVEKLGLKTEEQITNLTMMGRRLAGLWRTDVGGAVTMLVDLMSSGRMMALYRVVPGLKAYVDSLDKSLDDITKRTLVFNKTLELTQNLAAPGSNPFTRLKNSVADLADKMGMALFGGSGNFANGLDAITAKVKELTDWVEKNKTAIIEMARAMLWLAGSAVAGKLVAACVEIAIAIKGIGLAAVISKNWISLLITAIMALIVYWEKVMRAMDYLSVWGQEVKEKGLFSGISSEEFESRVAQRRREREAKGGIGYKEPYQEMGGTSNSPVPNAKGTGSGGTKESPQSKLQAKYDELLSGVNADLASHDIELKTLIPLLSTYAERLEAINSEEGDRLSSLKGLIPKLEEMKKEAEKLGMTDLAKKLGDWENLLLTKTIPDQIKLSETSRKNVDRLEKLDQTTKDFIQAMKDGTKYFQDMIHVAMAASSDKPGLAHGFTAPGGLTGGAKGAYGYFSDLMSSGINPNMGIYLQNELMKEGVKTTEIQKKAMDNVVGHFNKIGDHSKAAFDKLMSKLASIAGMTDAEVKDLLAGEKGTAVGSDVAANFANMLGSILSGGGKTSGKDLISGGMNALQPMFSQWGGGLASMLGMGANMAGPLGSIIGGVAGWGLGRLLGEKSMKIDKPVDVRITSINPQLANFFNFRGIDPYASRFRGVISGGLY